MKRILIILLGTLLFSVSNATHFTKKRWNNTDVYVSKKQKSTSAYVKDLFYNYKQRCFCVEFDDGCVIKAHTRDLSDFVLMTLDTTITDREHHVQLMLSTTQDHSSILPFDAPN